MIFARKIEKKKRIFEFFFKIEADQEFLKIVVMNFKSKLTCAFEIKSHQRTAQYLRPFRNGGRIPLLGLRL